MRSAENPRRRRPWPPFSRRDFLRAGAGAALSAGPLAGVLSLAACQEDTRPASRAAKFAARYGEALRRAEAAGSPVAVTRVAAPAEVEVGPGQMYRTWLYDGAFPGPEIRVQEGERLRLVGRHLPERIEGPCPPSRGGKLVRSSQ